MYNINLTKVDNMLLSLGIQVNLIWLKNLHLVVMFVDHKYTRVQENEYDFILRNG